MSGRLCEADCFGDDDAVRFLWPGTSKLLNFCCCAKRVRPQVWIISAMATNGNNIIATVPKSAFQIQNRTELVHLGSEGT